MVGGKEGKGGMTERGGKEQEERNGSKEEEWTGSNFWEEMEEMGGRGEKGRDGGYKSDK